MKTTGVALLLGLIFLAKIQAQEIKPAVSNNETTNTTSVPMEPKEPTYWVTFNSKVRPGQTMFFNVLILNESNPVTVEAFLMDNKGEKIILRSQPTICQPRVFTKIPIKIPYDVESPSNTKWQKSFKVQVEGSVGQNIVFNDSSFATLQEKAFTIFVQTDKAIYKPGQKVRVRAVAVTPDLKIMRNELYDIVVKDSSNNRILHYRAFNASDMMGVAEISFELADNIPTGDWKIETTVKGFTEKKNFEVSDYVLPKFEVEIDAPTFGLKNDTLLNFTVKAKYTFGKPVSDGLVTVEIRTEYFDYFYNSDRNGGRPRSRPTIKMGGLLDRYGMMNFSVNATKLLDLVQDHSSYAKTIQGFKFRINATVVEDRTGKMRSASHSIGYYSTPVNIKFLSITPKTFKSGLNFTAYLEVRKRDGTLFSPGQANKIKVNFTAQYSVLVKNPTKPPPPPGSGGNSSVKPIPLMEEPIAARSSIWNPNFGYYTVYRDVNLSELQRLQVVPENGWLILKFGVPKEANGLEITAKTIEPYSESDYAYYYGQPSRSPSDNFLQLNVTNHKPKVNDKVKVTANATEPIKHLNYQLSSKGALLHSERLNFNSTSKEIEFEFTVDSRMTPNLNLLAFYVREDGEFVVDALSLSVEGLFANSVELEFSNKSVKPGENVELKIKAMEESMVFLLAVDKSVKLLKSGNDITQELVQEELLKYEHGGYGSWRYMFICGWPSYYSGSDAASIFRNAGVQVLTDGTVYQYNDYYDDRVVFDDSVAGGNNPSAVDATPENGDTSASSDSETTRIRREFIENWLWDFVVISEESSGEMRINLTAPDTITTWVASAFSTHATGGLSVGAGPAEVTTFRDLFVSLDLPSFLVRYENFCFTASVFSYYEDPIVVSVQLERSPHFSIIYTKVDGRIVTSEKGHFSYYIVLGEMHNGDIESAMFCLSPEVIGEVPIRVNVETTIANLTDAVERIITVKPEGIPRVKSYPFLVTLTNGVWNENINASFPKRTVEGSQRITINVAGNLLSPIFENMDNLIQQPHGCGEQNMVNFSPLMSLMKFFIVTRTITPDIQTKIADFMLMGYQTELTYQHESGGFSAFGNRATTDEASTWLTAFVVKCFAQAEQLNTPTSSVIFIDTTFVYKAANWMMSKQNKDGQFREDGKVFNKRLQGGSGKGTALTAYSVIALFEASKAFPKDSEEYTNIISAMNRGVDYLESRLQGLTDVYDICIVAYALHLVDSPLKALSFSKLEAMASSGPNYKYWEPRGPQSTNNLGPKVPTSEAIEMNAYALLTYSLRGIDTTTDGLSIVDYLSKGKNPNGGFSSTQDTVLAIEALAKVATKLYGDTYVPMTVTVNIHNEGYAFNVVKEAEMLLQREEVPYQSIGDGVIELMATSLDPINTHSTVLVEIVLNYNVEEKSESNEYKLEFNVERDVLFSKISTVHGEKAGMTLYEIELPAGYTVNEKDVVDWNADVNRAELKEDKIVLYFDTDVIDGEGVKVVVQFERSGGVITKADKKRLKVISYYQPVDDLTDWYFLKLPEFCKSVPTFGLCPYR